MNLILPLKRVKYPNEVWKFRFTWFIYRNTLAWMSVSGHILASYKIKWLSFPSRIHHFGENHCRSKLGYTQGRSQLRSPGWARVSLSSFFPQTSIKFSIFPQTFTSFSSSFWPSAREGPGYATGCTRSIYMQKSTCVGNSERLNSRSCILVP